MSQQPGIRIHQSSRTKQAVEEKRQRILEIIEQQPGINMEDLVRELGLKPGAVTHLKRGHLREMAIAGVIHADKSNHWYPGKRPTFNAQIAD